MLYGLQQSVQRRMHSIIAEADSKLVTSCLTENSATPWRIAQEIEEIKKLLHEENVKVQHYFRETNRVADKLAIISHIHQQHLIFTRYEEFPRQVKALMKLDRWELASFRVRHLKATEINFDPP